MAAQNCANCFFVRTENMQQTAADGHSVSGSSFLACHALPPNTFSADLLYVRGWRKVSPNDWCGLWSSDGVAASVAAGQLGAPARYGTTTLDFGASPSGLADTVVNGGGFSGLTVFSNISVWIQNDPIGSVMLDVYPVNVVPGVGFTIEGNSHGALASGQVPVRWSYVNG